MNPGATASAPTTAALVLAGGRSSRMGAPKEAVLLDDLRPMIQHVLDAVRPLGFPVFVSCRAEPGEFLRGLGPPLIPDAEAFKGPLAAVARGLEVSGARRLMVVCCDQPLLRTDLLRRLVDATDERPAFFGNGSGRSLAPFPGVFPASALPAMREALAAGVRSPRYWLDRQNCRRVTISESGEATLVSINTMGQLAEVKRPGGAQ